METLDEFNYRRTRWHEAAARDANGTRPNGISCPQCEQELLDSEPLMTLSTTPPTMNVHCAYCDYVGYRVA